MSIVLFDPDLVIARVDGQVTAFKLVAGAADFASALAGLGPPPSAFVIPLLDRAGPSKTGTMIVAQRDVIRFGVAMAVQNLRDPRGEKAAADLKTLRIAVMTALLGWQPAGGYDPCEYGGGRLLQLTDQVLWWQDDYVTAIFLRSI